MSFLIGFPEQGESRINPVMSVGESRVQPIWLDTFRHLIMFLFQAHVLFWLQMTILGVGIAWCLALTSIVFFGGWYASTHPLRENDQMIRQLMHWLRFLTFGLTDAPCADERGKETNEEDWYKTLHGDRSV